MDEVKKHADHLAKASREAVDHAVAAANKLAAGATAAVKKV
jgi:hypothetical protein